MMRIVDDFKGLPMAEFELTVRHRGCWTGILSRAAGEELAIDPVTRKNKSLVVLVLMSKARAKSIEAMKGLKRTGAVRNYAQLQEMQHKAIYQVEVDPKTSILESIVDQSFELLSPVTVKDEIEKYRFGTFDISHADKDFAKLIGELKSMRNVSVLDYKSRKTEGIATPERSRLTEEDHDLIRELIESDYFNPNSKDRPRQEDLANKLGLSTGKLNQMLRKLEFMGFQNLLAVKPDLEEFRALLREVETEESIRQARRKS